MTTSSPAGLVPERLELLASLTDEPGRVCRTFLSPAMQRANALVGEWLAAAGGIVRHDGWGNLIGHFSGTRADARTLLLGSHLDTVRNAGKYDGPLGVLVALAAMEALHAEGITLPFHVDILAFADEEGARFHSAYLGSKAVAGLIVEADLGLRDAAGVSVGEAVAAFQQTPQVTLPQPLYRRDDLLGYVEVHIEQGPVLQEMNVPLGIVDHIAAQRRYLYTIEGRAGHAGTTPMNLRRDALAGAAECVLAFERKARTTPGLVATAGQLQVSPGSSNVIPQQAQVSLDIRHAEAEILQRACAELETEANTIAQARGLTLALSLVQQTTPVVCAPSLVGQLEAAVRPEQDTVPHLVSGAGHDAVILSRLTPAGMLFVRCRDGISHHPDEFVTADDIAAAVAALTRFLHQFDER